MASFTNILKKDFNVKFNRLFNLFEKRMISSNISFENINYPCDNPNTKVANYLVEQLNPTYDKLEKLYYKLERLKKPKYHENGRKKRITK